MTIYKKKWNKQFKILGMCQPSLCVSINYYYKLNFVNRVYNSQCAACHLEKLLIDLLLSPSSFNGCKSLSSNESLRFSCFVVFWLLRDLLIEKDKMEGRLIFGRRWNDLNEVDSNIDDASEDSVPTSIQILDGFFLQ